MTVRKNGGFKSVPKKPLSDDLIDYFNWAVLRPEFRHGSGGASHGVVNVEALSVDIEDLPGLEAAVCSGDSVEDA